MAEFKLVKTCGACPEQYDVYRNGEVVGYLRLRHSYFSARAHGPYGPTVYVTRDFQGDGAFELDIERDGHIRNALYAIRNALGDNDNSLYEIEDQSGG
jgi:hypothetical protein